MCEFLRLNQPGISGENDQEDGTVMKDPIVRVWYSLFLLAADPQSCSWPWRPARARFWNVFNSADQPFDNMKVESAHQLPVKTVLAKETYQGGAFRVLARKDP